MNKYSKRAFHVFLGLGLLVIFIGLVMVLLNAHANGVVGRGGNSRFASLNGWQVCFVGMVMLATGFLLKREIKK
jgi:hypothetical protein